MAYFEYVNCPRFPRADTTYSYTFNFPELLLINAYIAANKYKVKDPVVRQIIIFFFKVISKWYKELKSLPLWLLSYILWSTLHLLSYGTSGGTQANMDRTCK